MFKMTLTQIKAACSDAQNYCKDEYRREHGHRGFLIPRPRYVSATVYANRTEFHAFDGEEYQWDGTMKDLERAKEKASQKGELISISIFGAFNWAESLRDVQDGNYDPLVAEWEVEVV